jgi:serine/threonine-protein kinase
MAISPSFKRGPFWRTDWFVGILLVLGVLVLHLTTDVIGGWERRFYDFASTATAQAPSDLIAVIAIDDQSIASIGRWPWPRAVHARLIDELTGAKAKTIVHTAFFSELEGERGLSTIRKIKAVLDTGESSATPSISTHDQLAAIVAEAEAAFTADGPSALGVSDATRATNVIVAIALTLAEPPDRSSRPAFKVDSFDDVLSGKIPASKYTGKVVVIGTTAAGVNTPTPEPGRPLVSALEAIARIASGNSNERSIVQPTWGSWLTLISFVLVCAYIIAALPRLSTGLAIVLSLLLFTTLLGAEVGLLAGAALWLKLVFPATLLLLGQVSLAVKRFLTTEAGPLKTEEESSEVNRMMGLALQGQGQLDMAFERFRRVPMADALMGNLQGLALDFERQRQFNKAEAVYRYMATFQPDKQDLNIKLNRLKKLSETVLLEDHQTDPAGTLQLASGVIEKPMLGRYQIETELGKGAMGIVYLGKDPRIGRWVAIKTMALGDTFDGVELVDARERFFREAQTAGRLQHQNIVTIFDVGEEHELAYIAMEFLKGKNLVDFCQEGHLLPVPTVLSIVARVADALAYAHREHVVHRDIKPANVMYEMQSDTVKVTDFGIARITDSSKTKTGLVLGTPSFMSPEQLAGNKVDGRSDLYSLGVMLFQLLSGVLPFRGDSIAKLLYKIANEEAPDIRTLRPDLPAKLAALVALSLRKLPESRYQEGDQLALELRLVLSAASGWPQSPLVPPTAGPDQTMTALTPTVAAEVPLFQKTSILGPVAVTGKQVGGG